MTGVLKLIHDEHVQYFTWIFSYKVLLEKPATILDSGNVLLSVCDVRILQKNKNLLFTQ